ncbi:DUF3231 family protein [Evansella sp. AB-P1]|uniref:DUF3231 family protein n=1 Tax=Evansella sp. AB-P1 TaxID=3037653 RepID=UPI00241D3D19|nr:DUF3231 family protein [Evansella sp. AB-P1]MDG5789276.1 DUF3231 family protein [Evansella sp. AB-P1]
MSASQNVRINASEMASLWNGYMSQTHNICMLKYFIEQTEDPDTKDFLQRTNATSMELVNECKSLLEKENVPVPTGFTDEDVNIHAPRLFSDSFFLMYVKNMLRAKIAVFGFMNTACKEKELRNYFKKGLDEGVASYDEVTDLMLEKGIYMKPPFIEPPEEVDFVEDKEYLDRQMLLKENRDLNAIEISHVFGNIEANMVGKLITKGFKQTADIKEVREFMEQGEEMTEKRLKAMSKLLSEHDLPIPMASEPIVYRSTEAPFSDKLMMFQMTLLTAAAISEYATSLAASMRSDLVSTYMNAIKDTSKLALKGSALMIENNWLEQPPQ